MARLRSFTKSMPECFQLSFGKDVGVNIDCFEVFMERPSNLEFFNVYNDNTPDVAIMEPRLQLD